MYLLAWMLWSAAASASATTPEAERCTYTATVWSAVQRATSRTVVVDKARAELTEAERGPLGCTPCEQDQVEVPLAPGLAITLCAAVVPRVMPALARALAEGAVIDELIGYRPSISRGPLDARGERTVLSNHAFGVALDVNASHNGLYDRCPTWSSACRLLKGGPWDPTNPRAMTLSHPVVTGLAAAGWAWGGELAGQQKDFMHFSPTGD